jgi:hypothetical protein
MRQFFPLSLQETPTRPPSWWLKKAQIWSYKTTHKAGSYSFPFPFIFFFSLFLFPFNLSLILEST